MPDASSITTGLDNYTAVSSLYLTISKISMVRVSAPFKEGRKEVSSAKLHNGSSSTVTQIVVSEILLREKKNPFYILSHEGFSVLS